MPAERHDLEALFAPPAGEHGTQALLTGLSADVPVLQRALAAFTGETPAQRAASGLIRGLLLLDASSPRLPPTAVPGMLHLAPCLASDWQKRTTLLHAKVALLGFGASRCAATTRWRLIVATGNWTEATWARQAQIDFFWKTQWSLVDDDTQALADVAEAFAFFERVLKSLYGDHLAMLSGQALTMDWLTAWRTSLQTATRSAPDRPLAQFVHSLDGSLASQIRERFPRAGVNTLVAGSGFLEQASPGDASQPAVLRELERLGRPGTRYLVFNTAQAGQLAHWIGQNKPKGGRIGKWDLCSPCDPLQKGRAGRTFLHAKYIAGIGPIRSGSAKVGFLYLGSGNLSNLGYMGAARLGGRGDVPGAGPLGNVEAGVLLTQGNKVEQVWRRLACGATLDEAGLAATAPGEGEALFAPANPPPILLARHVPESPSGAGHLRLERSAVPPQPLEIRQPDGEWMPLPADASRAPWAWPESPAILRVRTDLSAEGAQQEWEVPVFAADGLFCKRPVAQLPLTSILQALTAFPAPVPDEADDDPDGEDQNTGHAGGTTPRPSIKASPYPLRSLAALVEAIADRNESVTREEFPYWLNQLRVLLLEQATEADRTNAQALGVDLFDALLEPGFRPPWLHRDAPWMSQYVAVVDQLRAGWTAPLETGHA